ncbi:MAG: IclR family transcriptional regulator [Bacteroidales bacterium]|jgi:DNA-binding IclR family transcriptional regulator|nr:IclR family transcriptional regulator [Bacteroidales bacterium]
MEKNISHKENEGENYHVPGLEKGLIIMEHLASYPKGLNLQEIKSSLNISQTTAYRVLQTLVKLGYLLYNETEKSYRLSTKLLTIGFSSLNEHHLLEIVLPCLRELRDIIKETVCFGILGSEKGVFIEQAQGHHAFRFVLAPGKSFELHCSAPGKAMMAYLPDVVRNRYLSYMGFEKYNDRTITNEKDYLEELEKVRKVGYALDNEEELSGVICVAAPIFNYRGYPCGVIWTSGPKDRLTPQAILVTAGQIREMTEKISLSLGYSRTVH